MALKLISLTLNTPNLKDQIDFYNGIGFELERVQIKKGGEVYRARLNNHAGGFEINLFGMREKQTSEIPVLQFCFSVADLDTIFKTIRTVRGVQTLLEPSDMPEGRKAIVQDPDGNSIEILQV